MSGFARTPAHAMVLFAAWDSKALPGLYEWLSRRNIDANDTPHADIRRQVEAEAADGVALALAALGRKA